MARVKLIYAKEDIDGIPCYWIVDEVYFTAHECVRDCGYQFQAIPSSFQEEMESCWSYTGDKTAEEELSNAEITFSQELQDLIDSNSQEVEDFINSYGDNYDDDGVDYDVDYDDDDDEEEDSDDEY